MAITIELPSEEAQELVWDSVEDIMDGTTRWGILYKSIVLYKDEHWAIYWEDGATENQDYNSFTSGYGDDTTTLTKVIKKVVTREEWVNA